MVITKALEDAAYSVFMLFKGARENKDVVEVYNTNDINEIRKNFGDESLECGW